MKSAFLVMLATLAATVSAAIAAAPDRPSTRVVSYFFGDRVIRLVDDEKQGLLISESCRDGKGQFHCKAIEAVHRARPAAVRATDEGGINPGSRICSEQLKGTVVLGTDDHEGEQTFCLFPDGSLLSCDSLEFHANSSK